MYHYVSFTWRASKHFTEAFRSQNSHQGLHQSVNQWSCLNTYTDIGLFRILCLLMFIATGISFHWKFSASRDLRCCFSLRSQIQDGKKIHWSTPHHSVDEARCRHHSDGSHVCRSQNTWTETELRPDGSINGLKIMKQIEKTRDIQWISSCFKPY